MTGQDKPQTDGGATAVVRQAGEAADARACPFCGQPNTLAELERSNYACRHCRKETAHVDLAPNGTARGIYGWLLVPGEVALERYKVQSVLGKGGFGAAYLVDDLQLSGKRRAMKEIPEPMFDEYEAALLSRLDHPAIPDIIERKAAAGKVYLVLKFGGSRTLESERARQPQQRIPLPKLLPWMRQLCDVLAYLHEQNPPVIHRDLKPGNILLDENERIMLIDFGIAKEATDALTRTLARAASLHFSPPEQIMNTGGTDARSDIYALAATFYALLTGHNPPAAHERVAGQLLQAPSALVPEVPAAIDAALLQALELNMTLRQQTIRTFAQALEGEAPAWNEEFVQRTQLTGQTPGPQTAAKSASLKIPTGRAEAAPQQYARAAAPRPQ